MFKLVIAVISSVTIILVLLQLFKGAIQMRRSNKTINTLRVLGSLLILYGVVGFFGAALSATGALSNLAPGFEFPMGVVTEAVTASNGDVYCPSNPFGRIQVYNKDLRYLRGWFVEAFGGSFRIRLTTDNNVEVVTARQQRRYIYDSHGILLLASTYLPSSYSDYEHWPGNQMVIPTPIFLWPMSSPLGSWVVGMLGMAMLAIIKKWEPKEIT